MHKSLQHARKRHSHRTVMQALAWGAIAAAVGAVVAAPAPQDRPERPAGDRPASTQAMLHRASHIIGKNIVNAHGEELGEVADLAIHMRSGGMPFIIMSYGGKLGVGDKHLAVPTTMVTLGVDQEQVMVDLVKERLKQAPAFELKDWSSLWDERWMTSMRDFYGDRIDFTWSNDGQAPDGIERGIDLSSPVELTGRIKKVENAGASAKASQGMCLTIDAGGEDRIVHLGPAGYLKGQGWQPADGATVTVAGYNAQIDGKSVVVARTIQSEGKTIVLRDETGRAAWTHSDSLGGAAAATLVRATKVIDMNVINAADKDLGEVEDLVIDLQRGKVRYAVLSFGGLLGINEKYFAMPWSLFKPSADGESFVLDISKERLETAPGFDKDNWPNLADQQWANEADRYYQVPADADSPRREAKPDERRDG
jgi:sporulation protein YlmC with PRC-barrel domain